MFYFTDAMIQTTTFDYYDAANTNCNLVRKINRPLGNSHIDQTWTTNPSGGNGVDSQEDAYGNETTLSFSQDVSGDTVTTVTHPDSSQRVFNHIRDRYPQDVTDENGNQFSMDYNSDDQMTSVTDRLEGSTSITYDETSGMLASFTNAARNTVSYTYASQNQAFTNPANSETFSFTFYDLTRIDYPDGTSEQFTYDTNGNRLTRMNQAGKTWTYTYNRKGQVLTVTNPTSGVRTYTYSGDGTMASSTDSDTGTKTYSYDTYKRVTTITYPDSTTVQIAYDLNDQMTSITDENNNVHGYAYDANSNLTTITDPAGNTTRYSYDLMDRVSQVIDRLGKVSTFSYDTMGRLTTLTEPSGNQTVFSRDSRGWVNQVTLGGQTWQTNYDSEGVVSSESNPSGTSTTYQTDSLGLVTSMTDSLGGTVTLTRDAMTRITGITDVLDRTTRYDHNNLGLLSGVTAPEIGSCSYTRSDLGQVTRINDLNDQNWDFTQTSMGRPQTASDPLGNNTQHTYDTVGRLSQTTYPDGVTLTRTYDNVGNVTRMLFSDGTDLQFSYDSLSQLLTSNSLSFTRDAESRITATQDQGITFGATYDDAGRVKTATYNDDAFTVTYTYDSTTALLSRVTDDLTNTQVDFAYDTDGRLTGISRSNGVNSTLTWDSAGRLTRIQDGSSIDLQYSMDAAGQVTQVNMTVPSDPANALTLGTDSFAYDAASRVSGTGYSYDSRGRLTASQGHTFQWNGTSAVTGIDSVSLAYNGLGDVVTRTDSNNTVLYYYNGAIDYRPIVAEQDETSGQFLRYYVWTPDGGLLYMIDAADSNKVSFCHFDRIGSTLALTDSTGSITDSYAYLPYGKLLEHEGTSAQPFTFLGRWGVRQEGSGGDLYQTRVRYYGSVTARFLNREPLWPSTDDPREINPYQYAFNNPISHLDPTGLDVIEDTRTQISAAEDRLQDAINRLGRVRFSVENTWSPEETKLRNEIHDLDSELHIDLNLGIRKMEQTIFITKIGGVVTDVLGGPKIKVKGVKVGGNAAAQVAGKVFDLGGKFAKHEMKKFKNRKVQVLLELARKRARLAKVGAQRRQHLQDVRKQVEELENQLDALRRKLKRLLFLRAQVQKAQQLVVKALDMELRRRGILIDTEPVQLGKRKANLKTWENVLNLMPR
jgi:RHS repeat-associated protein